MKTRCLKKAYIKYNTFFIKYSKKPYKNKGSFFNVNSGLFLCFFLDKHIQTAKSTLSVFLRHS